MLKIKKYKKGGTIEYTNSVKQPIAPTVSQNPTTPGKLDPQEQAAIQRRLDELETSQQMYQKPTDYRTPAEKQYYEQKRITELEKEGLTPEGYPTGRTKVNKTLDPVVGLIEKGIDASVVYEAGLLGAKGLRTLAKKVGSKISIPKGYTGHSMTDIVPFEPVYPTRPYRPPGGRTFPVLPARTPTGMPTLVDVPELTKEQQVLKNFGLDPYKTKAPISFTSEINWGKWNVEIPNNPALLSEYNTIEQTSKNAGTWMKNPDGSAFQGTPEQFVQQNSQNFKKAFPDVLKDEAGNIQKTYHGSQDKFEIFDPNITRVGRTRGSGIYTSPVKERAASYANKGEKQLYEFYQNASKPQDIVEQFEKAADKRFRDFLEKNPKQSKNFDKKFDEFIKKEDELFNLADEDFNLQKGYDFFKASPDEYVVPFTNYPKSAIGNNGMFDMTNPNIYKALVPVAGTAGLLQDNKQYGGTINNNNMKNPKGMYWNGTRYVKAKGSGTWADPDYYANGGPAKFWELPSPSRTPGAEGMVDYGSMYSLPNKGLFQKSIDSEWEGFGNPANLMNQPIQSQMQSMRSMQPMQKATVNKKSFYEADGEGDYSIDAVRSQYMNGGNIQVPYMAGQPKLSYGGVLGRQYNNPQYTHVTGLAKYGGVLGNQYNNPEYTHVTGLMKDGGIHIKPENKGKFTAWAQSHGMGVQEAASHVMANKEDYSSGVVRMANFARNFGGNKKQYGGSTMRRYADGGVTDENPIGGATTFTGENPAGMSTTAPTQNSYDPSTDANNPVNQNLPMPQQGGYAAAQGAAYDTTGITDSQPDQSAPPTGPKQPRQPFGTGYRNLLGAAMMYGQYAADRRQQKGLKAYGIQQGMTQMNPVQQQFSAPGRFGRYGGSMQPEYAIGGTYELTDDEIQKLKMGGYKLKMC